LSKVNTEQTFSADGIKLQHQMMNAMQQT